MKELKDEMYIIMSIDAENVRDKVQHPFIKKKKKPLSELSIQKKELPR